MMSLAKSNPCAHVEGKPSVAFGVFAKEETDRFVTDKKGKGR